MKRSKRFLCMAAAATAVLACASGAAQARVFVGVGVGMGMPYYSPFYGGYYSPYAVAPLPYAYPAYAPAPVIAAPAPPPDYIEQAQPVVADPDAEAPSIIGPNDAVDDSDAQQGDTWYYCDASRTYYPYVKTCSSAWRSVPARPGSAN